jgi:hypothetical protein
VEWSEARTKATPLPHEPCWLWAVFIWGCAPAVQVSKQADVVCVVLQEWVEPCVDINTLPVVCCLAVVQGRGCEQRPGLFVMAAVAPSSCCKESAAGWAPGLSQQRMGPGCALHNTGACLETGIWAWLGHGVIHVHLHLFLCTVAASSASISCACDSL